MDGGEECRRGRHLHRLLGARRGPFLGPEGRLLFCDVSGSAPPSHATHANGRCRRSRHSERLSASSSSPLGSSMPTRRLIWGYYERSCFGYAGACRAEPGGDSALPGAWRASLVRRRRQSPVRWRQTKSCERWSRLRPKTSSVFVRERLKDRVKQCKVTDGKSPGQPVNQLVGESSRSSSAVRLD
jgi:hypothetical protein